MTEVQYHEGRFLPEDRIDWPALIPALEEHGQRDALAAMRGRHTLAHATGGFADLASLAAMPTPLTEDPS